MVPNARHPVPGPDLKPAPLRPLRGVLVVVACGLLGGCAGPWPWGPPVSRSGQLRCEGEARRDAGVLQRWLAHRRCLGTVEQRLAQERAAAARRQAAAAAQRLAFCRRTRPRASQLVAAWRAEQAAADQLRARTYRPLPRPQPPDPVLQSKLPLYDQELDQERYALAVQAWQTKDAARSGAWLAERRRQLASSERRLELLRRELQALNPALLAPGPPPALVDAAVHRFTTCRPEDFR